MCDVIVFIYHTQKLFETGKFQVDFRETFLWINTSETHMNTHFMSSNRFWDVTQVKFGLHPYMGTLMQMSLNSTSDLRTHICVRQAIISLNCIKYKSFHNPHAFLLLNSLGLIFYAAATFWSVARRINNALSPRGELPTCVWYSVISSSCQHFTIKCEVEIAAENERTLRAKPLDNLTSNIWQYGSWVMMILATQFWLTRSRVYKMRRIWCERTIQYQSKKY